MKPNKRVPTALLILAALALIVAVAIAQGKKVLDAQTLAVGTVAPDYSLPDQNGQVHTLASDKGKIVLLAFYPADFTGGCTLEAHALTSADKDLQTLGVQVYGVSVQDPTSHKAFCTKEGIPYTLLADTEKTASKSYGVLIPGAGVANRVTYIIGRDSKIIYVDKSVNSHLTTCGEDWVTWLKAHNGPKLAEAGTAALGKPAPVFTLPEVLKGEDMSLGSALQGKKAAVVMFISTRCPISNAYDERMAALANEYAAKGVAFVAINANYNEPLSEVKAHTLDHNFPFPVLKDAGNRVADAYDAHVTPETYIINSDGVLVYHGRIDNSDDPSQVTTHDLAAALDEVLAGQPVTKATTKAFGCSIKRAS